jgi:hypothetical protein
MTGGQLDIAVSQDAAERFRALAGLGPECRMSRMI